ncbi:hypothetical protein ADIS_2191 [Lunatimonas lonarensis]|uniref:Uncharacterized protein n=1 Tax=Lunatimonas lonarensis TaxID=1232681 RepID=R7ZTG2_9BACT|nr:AtpZ/AtpI family protein [Lunatimonas lonarensis]EON77323.1 hypothetical protein ADIS_2191 [Lunatimonas lonarensis]
MSPKPQDPTPTFTRFIGLAFQMITLIGLGGYFGYLLDARSSSNFPTWLLSGSLLGTIIAFYQLFKSLPKS